MQSICEYIKESLLDDLDVLDNSSELAINRSQTIGNDYNLKYVYMVGPTRYFCNTFDKRKIKKYTENLYWKNQEICVYDSGMHIIENKSVEEMLGYICNIILSGDKNKIMDKEYIKSLFESVVKDDVMKGKVWFKHLIISTENRNNVYYIEIISNLAQRSPKAVIILEKK